MARFESVSDAQAAIRNQSWGNQFFRRVCRATRLDSSCIPATKSSDVDS